MSLSPNGGEGRMIKLPSFHLNIRNQRAEIRSMIESIFNPVFTGGRWGEEIDEHGGAVAGVDILLQVIMIVLDHRLFPGNIHDIDI